MELEQAGNQIRTTNVSKSPLGTPSKRLPLPGESDVRNSDDDRPVEDGAPQTGNVQKVDALQLDTLSGGGDMVHIALFNQATLHHT